MENFNTKYSPKNINECFISSKNKNIIERMLKNKCFGNVIFYGGIGCGKSKVIEIICNELRDEYEIEHIDILLSNDNKNIYGLLERNCAFNNRMGKKTIFVIKDFHLIKPKLQNNFVVLLNKVKNAFIFIETTNIIDISKNIQNISTIIKFDNIIKKRYIEFVKIICKKENMKIEDVIIDQLFIITNGDIKSTLNYLTAMKIIGDEINLELFEKVFSIPSSITIHKIINGIIEGNEELVMKECDKLIEDKFDCNEIMLKLFNDVISENIDEDDKHIILEKLGKQIYKFNKYQKENNMLKTYIKEIIDLF